MATHLAAAEPANTALEGLWGGDRLQLLIDAKGGRIVALELATGQRLWEQNFAGISTPWVAGDWLFVVTGWP